MQEIQFIAPAALHDEMLRMLSDAIKGVYASVYEE